MAIKKKFNFYDKPKKCCKKPVHFCEAINGKYYEVCLNCKWRKKRT